MSIGEGGGPVSRADTSTPEAPAGQTGTRAESPIIATLQDRRSVLPSGSAYDRLASAVLTSSARAAEAELVSARLRAEAEEKNWLPRIGPNISLSSLGDLVASLIVEQVIFDNGRKKAERAFARADVEVAAVTLSEDRNTRVHDALGLYLTAMEGRESAALADRSLRDMGHFEWVMTERVKGGVSDPSDLNVTRQKLAELRSSRAAAGERAQAALAELGAMTALPIGELGAPSRIDLPAAEPLSVVRAEAEKERRIAAATIERAGHLPGLKAGGTVGKGGSGIGLQVTSDSLLGIGTGASLKAIEATKDAAQRQVGEAREQADRRLKSQQVELAALERQAAEAASMTASAKRTLDLFQAQYEAGQRQVMDVVGVYENFARQQQEEVRLKYAAARLKLEMARDLGLLADGSRI